MKKYNLLILLLLSNFSSVAQSAQKHDNELKPKTDRIVVFTTAYNSKLRLTPTDTLTFSKGVQPIETEITIVVNPLKSFQKCIGIGGAITDASAEVFAKLTTRKQQELLDAYYSDQKGIGYTLARTNIHSCDFSSESYTYVSEGDKTLKSFNISHDLKFRIPLLKKAIKATNGRLLIFASPWSPPAFMKDNDDILHGGKLIPEYYQSWANYFVKFIKAYEKEGINIWGVTVQNEPLAKQRWESCQFTAEEERDFVKLNLGPTMQRNGLKDKKIIVWDHNRDIMNQYANVILSDPIAAKYVWGVGFHWYETWTGGEPMFTNVKQLYEAYPNKSILLTEACVEHFDINKYNYWPNAERYGVSIIQDFNNGAVGWTDWNILLDEQGGPNHVKNFSFAPIHADLRTGELIYTPSFYYLGHFSKFIKPGAKRLSTSSTRGTLICTSFLNTDQSIATVVLNQSETQVKYNLNVSGNYAEIVIPPHAIQTLVHGYQ